MQAGSRAKSFDKILPWSFVRVPWNSTCVFGETNGAGGVRLLLEQDSSFPFLFFSLLFSLSSLSLIHVFTEGPARPHPSQHILIQAVGKTEVKIQN